MLAFAEPFYHSLFNMDLDGLKRRLQDHLTDGLVLIVGSGVSSHLGIATMSQLADHISTRPPREMTNEIHNQWDDLLESLSSGTDLEAAMSSIDLHPVLEEHVVSVTADLIQLQERRVVCDAISGVIKLPLAELLRHLMATASCLPVITTNYDRLIELAADITDIGVDSMFVGQLVSRFDHTLSREALGYATHTQTRKGIKRSYRKHIKILKPHGSLDWFDYKGSPVRCGLPLELPRLMITPGRTKYVRGYEQPFDAHRNAANESIDKAARFLILGFGFNDKQLETHLRPQIKNGRPCVIMSRELTANALEVIRSSNSVLALSRETMDGATGTLVTSALEQTFFPGPSLWNLEFFLSEVLR